MRKAATLIHFFLNFRMIYQFSRLTYFDIWFANAKECRVDAILNHILQEMSIRSIPDEIIDSLKAKIRSYSQQIDKKWSKSGRHRDRFLKANSKWLEGNFTFDNIVTESVASNLAPEPSNRAGRPHKDFESCSYKTKKRRVQHLLDTSSEGELSFAAEVQLRNKGKRELLEIRLPIMEHRDSQSENSDQDSNRDASESDSESD